EVLAQSQSIEQPDRVHGQNVARRLARIKCEQDGDETPHDMGVAVAGEGQHRPGGTVGADRGDEPNLTGATLNFVGFRSCGITNGSQSPPELDDIAVAVVPVVEQGEIISNLVDGRHQLSGRVLGVQYPGGATAGSATLTIHKSYSVKCAI